MVAYGSILPVGDSITVGTFGSDAGSYRDFLPAALTSAGHTFTLLAQHAQSGWTVNDATVGLAARITADAPAVLLVYLGVNDIRNDGESAAVVAQDMADLIAAARSADPNVDIVLAKIAPAISTETANNATIVDYNAELVALAASLDTAGARTVTADCYTGFTDAMLVDSVHPNDLGDEHISDGFLAALGTLEDPPGVWGAWSPWSSSTDPGGVLWSSWSGTVSAVGGEGGYRYDARWRATGDVEWVYVEGIGPEPWTLTDLAPGTEYEAQFRAHDPDTGLTSAWSDSVVATTASVGVAGTASWSEDGDTAAGAGTHTPPSYTGTSAWVEDDDTAAGAGTHAAPTFTATAAWVEADDVAAGTGASAPPEGTGTASWVEDDDTAAAVGTHTPPAYTATAAWNEQDDTATAAGVHVPPGTVGTAAWTEADDTATGAGAHVPPSFEGTAAWTEADDTATGAGVAVLPGTGYASWTEADDTMAAVGTFVPSDTPTPLFYDLEATALSPVVVRADALSPAVVRPDPIVPTLVVYAVDAAVVRRDIADAAVDRPQPVAPVTVRPGDTPVVVRPGAEPAIR